MKLANKLILTLIITLVGFMSIADDRFTSEAQLTSRITGEIHDFWQQGDFASFSGVNNTRINYARFIHGDSKQLSKCLVISSGRTESYLKYQELSYDLFQLGYSLFFIDHRGQGLSERTQDNPDKGHVDDFQYYVDDLATFIDNHVTPHCAEKPYLLAHSMGGAISARYLQDHPNKIKAAVLASPMIGFNGGGIPDAIAKPLISFTALLNRWFDDKAWYFLGHKDYAPTDFTDNVLMHSAERYQIFSDVYQNTTEIQLGGVTTQWLKSSVTALDKIFKNLDKIQTPTLVLQSGEDTVVSNQAQHDFCQQLHRLHPQSCPEGKPVVIAGAFHELFFESDIYRIPALTALVDWLEQHP